MKRYALLCLLLVMPVLAGNIMFDEALPLPNQGQEVLEANPMPFLLAPGETLKYDNGTFDNGLGINGSGTTPTQAQTYGFATYFILDTFGITTPREVEGVMLQWSLIGQPGYLFRLYVWNNVTQALLRPRSAGPHLYKDSAAVFPSPGVWGYWDLSSLHIAVPETVWVGICYNHISNGPPADWYLAFNSTQPDLHTRGNLSGTAGAWNTFAGLGAPQYDRVYAVRLVVKPLGAMVDAGAISIDMDTLVPQGSVVTPMATVKNYGTDSADFNVTCEINPGAYSSVGPVTDLAPGESIQVSFSPDFTFDPGSYTVKVYTQLGGDTNPANDTLVKVVNTYDPGVTEGGSIPKTFAFRAPTITKGRATIEFSLPASTKVDLLVYDAVGRLSRTLISERFAAGTHRIEANLDLATGVYFYNLKTELGTVTKKFLIVE